MELMQQMAVDMLIRGELSLTLSREAMDSLEARCFEVLERMIAERGTILDKSAGLSEDLLLQIRNDTDIMKQITLKEREGT